MKPLAVALGSDDEAAGQARRNEESLADGLEAFHFMRISRHLFGEALSYFALMLTFQPAARHLVCGPLQAVVFSALFCWFAVCIRRRRGCRVLLGGFHFYTPLL
jgi:hypothetical protein